MKYFFEVERWHIFCVAIGIVVLSIANVQANSADELAGQILDIVADRGGGLLVHAGCTDGKLTAALGADGRWVVQGLSRNKSAIPRLRRNIAAQTKYGDTSVQYWGGDSLPYLDNLVNCIVVQSSQHRLSVSEIRRVLAPRGILMIGKDAERLISEVHEDSAIVSSSPSRVKGSFGNWHVYRKAVPAEIDDWGHWLHGADNNAVSSDRRVGISRSMQWSAPPQWSRHHNLPAGFNALVSSGGRVYYLVDEAPNAVYGPGQWALVARDAFNGLELWRKEMKDWNMEAWGAEKRYGGRVGRFHGAPDLQAPRRIVATEKHLFVTLGFKAPVSMIDGATGQVLKKYPQTRFAGEIIYQNGILYVAGNTSDSKPAKEIMAIDTKTGETLWENANYRGIVVSTGYQKKYPNTHITAGKKHLFLADRNEIVALDMEKGREVWKKEMPITDDVVGDIGYIYNNFCTLAYRSSTLFFSQIHPNKSGMNSWQMKKNEIVAFDATTGRRKWNYTGGTLAHVTSPDLFVNKGKVWTLDPSSKGKSREDNKLIGLDAKTGKEAIKYTLKDLLHGHHHRCYRNKATEKFYLMGEEGLEYIDFDSGESDAHYWVRGACRYGIMPANGLIYIPPHNCGCHLGTMLHGFMALKSSSSLQNTSSGEVLEKGPAYNPDFDGYSPSKEDWPVFRHNNMRSASTTASLPAKLSRRWDVDLGGKIVPPIVAGGKVFTASSDHHKVFCLDARTGQIVWQFFADGPINSPPSYYKGQVFFGTRAGSLYCLRAKSGEEVWRFKVGPCHTQLMASGKLESPWPLDGSPLLLNGKIYCVAGRAMQLDGGLYVYELDAATGQMTQKTRLEANRKAKGELKGAVLPDIMLSDGKRIFMNGIRFEPDDIARHKHRNIFQCQTEMVDGSWLNCCFWSYKGFKAQQLAFDEQSAYGVKAPRKLVSKSFRHDVYRPGKGFTLLKEESGKNSSREEADVPVGAKAIALTADNIYLAGIPDTAPDDDYWAAFEGRKGGLLCVVSKRNPAERSQYHLQSPPVYNGIAIANETLFLSLENGHLVSYSDRE